MASNLGLGARGKRRGVGFGVAEMTIKRGERSASADNAQVDANTTRFMEKLLGGFHQFAAQSETLARRIDGKQTNVATITPQLSVDAAAKTVSVLSKEKPSCLHIGAHAVGSSPIAVEDGALDGEGGVDETNQGIHIALLAKSNV